MIPPEVIAVTVVELTAGAIITAGGALASAWYANRVAAQRTAREARIDNFKYTWEATHHLIGELQEELGRVRGLLKSRDAEMDSLRDALDMLRRENSELNDTIAALERTMAALQREIPHDRNGNERTRNGD